MHEHSIARRLLSQVAAICQQQGAESVTQVQLELGPLSGVVPELLKSAFAQLRTGSPAESAELVIEMVPLLVRCDACCHEWELSGFRFECTECGHAVTVISGDGILLVSVVVVEPTTASESLTDGSDESCFIARNAP